MAVKKYRLGPGTLNLDGTAYQAQVRKAVVQWASSTSSTDEEELLSGDVLPGDSDTTFSASFAATFVQDIDAAGLVEWSWTNRGVEVPFEFVPSTIKGRKVTGTITVIPIDLGGDVGDGKPKSDVTFPFTPAGLPVLGDVGP